MKIAVSNIAWPTDLEDTVAMRLAQEGVRGIEIAPTKVWPVPSEVADVAIDAYRRFWESLGISIVAAQALLFGKPELALFTDAYTRGQTLAYLEGIIRLCGRLGARAMVFGSPKNRRIGSQDPAAAWQQAIDFFGRLGEIAVSEGTAIVIEANPAEYGSDFITRATEALELVRAVQHPGFRLHLDTACMAMAGDDPEAIIRKAAGVLAHFHASEPNLAPVGQGPVDHTRFAAQLAAAHYEGWVSIEMRQIDPFDLGNLLHSVRLVQGWYQG
jgi:sugar phosphate isomerase/epimerase